MRSNTTSTALAMLGLGLVLAACSTSNAGGPARLASTPAAVSAALTPDQQMSTPSTLSGLGMAASAITEPDESAAPTTAENSDDGAPCTYSPPPQAQATIDGWLAQFTNGAAFLGWTVTRHRVRDVQRDVPASRRHGPDDGFGILQGSISGTSVTLTFSHGFGSTVSAQLTGDTLSLSVPQSDGSLQVEVFHPGTTADYNAQVQVVRASATQLQEQAASAAAVAEQESASAASVASRESASSEHRRRCSSRPRTTSRPSRTH